MPLRFCQDPSDTNAYARHLYQADIKAAPDHRIVLSADDGRDPFNFSEKRPRPDLDLSGHWRGVQTTTIAREGTILIRVCYS